MMKEEMIQQNVENALQQISHQLQALTHVMMAQGGAPKP